MKTKLIYLALASALSATLTVSAFAQEKNAKDDQTFTPAELTERTIHRRAIEAMIWGMPAVNAELMFQAMKNAKVDFNQVVYWSRPVTWKNQTLTPNPDTIYLMPFYNTKEAGPMVLEIPPAGEGESITGSIDEAWQTALEDVGPAGVDKGKGGKYLILPPEYKEKVPGGYIALKSGTYTGYALLRSNLKSASEAKVAKAVAYGKRIKFYALSQAANPPPTKFVDSIDIVFDSTIPYDLRFFQTLDRFVQREPWYERDRIMIDQLKAIGIEKGKPFIYLNITPSKNDGTTIYKLNVKDVPVDGFWSITLYNAEGYLVKNDLDAYSFNNITAKKNDHGSVTIQFGGCDGKTPNCLPIMKGWNYTVRLYRPRKEIVDETWKFPDAQPQ